MKNRFKKKQQKGFTLVELSIVLVIIGLIVSSVLVGQDLVRAAELRAVVQQYESFNAAVGTFRGKYSGVPGDVAGNTDFGFIGNGNGDGFLGASTDLTAANNTITDSTGENVAFWSQLGSTGASLIAGSYEGQAVLNTTAAVNLPKSKAGQYWGVFGSGSKNYFVVGVVGAGSGVYATTGVFNPLDAKSIDEKIDDGRPGRGSVQARGEHATDANLGTVATCASSVTTELPDSASTYVTTGEDATCTLRMRFNI